MSDLPPLEPAIVDYATRQGANTSLWPFLCITLIGWSAVGVIRFLAIAQDTGVSLLLVPHVLYAAGCIALLWGGYRMLMGNVSNTTWTIGAAAICLYFVLTAWFGSLDRAGPARFFALAQEIWLPMALVILKVRTSPPADASTPISGLGSLLPLLLAAQIPGFAGMVATGALATGLLPPGQLGGTVLFTLMLTFAGSGLSCILSFAFIGTPHARLAKRLCLVHVIFLAGLIATCSYLIATAKSSYRGPGGF